MNDMNWNILDSEEQLKQLVDNSKSSPQLILKDSKTCSISAFATERLHQSWDEELPIDVWEVDVIADRPLSQEIAARFNIQHESPQVLLIRDGQCTYTTSHLDIRPEVIEAQLEES